ncbi:hypothetical protein IEO21_10595 [Rhodonia placenta]|uniref:NADP-dependent oxidoreductase domain-containing protein n=1 Tax=Rhodonia placenta TaxID=104341 RepID=A0A8H7TXA3_9APHY|nr:hypothetical protein IEO21_10595 [Postia placenta]
MQKTPYVFPIVGGRKVEHLMDNIAALNIALSPAQIAHLEDVLPFDVGFPTSMIVSAFDARRGCLPGSALTSGRRGTARSSSPCTKRRANLTSGRPSMRSARRSSMERRCTSCHAATG